MHFVRARRAEDELDYPGPVTEVYEYEAAVVPSPLYPAHEAGLFSYVRRSNLPAVRAPPPATHFFEQTNYLRSVQLKMRIFGIYSYPSEQFKLPEAQKTREISGFAFISYRGDLFNARRAKKSIFILTESTYKRL